MTEESMPFSKRYGHAPTTKGIQANYIDADLRNGLWNALMRHYFEPLNYFSQSKYRENYPLKELIGRLWENYYKRPLDEIPDESKEIFNFIKEAYYNANWQRVYDLLEFVTNNYRYPETNEEFCKYCNKILEREFAAYRFVGEKILQNTSEREIKEIEKALENPLSSVQTHLKTSVAHLSNREHPDYRNSIKEAISAVEALCQKITGAKVTLGDALGTIEKNSGIKIPIPMRAAFEKLYGYTNTSQGIRHALTDIPDLQWEDAMFMLVSCSAFVNYLTAKADKAGITLCKI